MGDKNFLREKKDLEWTPAGSVERKKNGPKKEGKKKEKPTRDESGKFIKK